MAKISKLATSQYITDKHWEYRDGSQIKYIIPHHMAGKATGANCAYYFVHNGIQNSANYCIGYDGDISCNVPEEYGAWTSSHWGADKYGITFEVSDTAYGDWRIPANAQEAMIQLMVDLIQRYPSLGGKAVFDPSDEDRVVACKRAGIPVTGTKGNVIIHMWTSAYGTGCPGEHMISILPDICKEVNKRLGAKTSEKTGTKIDTTTYTVRQAAQKAITDGINGKARTKFCEDNKLDSTKVQAEIDLMLGKDTGTTVLDLVGSLPAVTYGSTGTVVTFLQKELKRMGYYAGTLDGACGAQTVTAIKELQKNWNKVYGSQYEVDGAFGPICWKRLLTGK